jgi:Pvc16 N-terminal domain
MSNALAIAAVTTTLRNLLDTQVKLVDGLSDLDVTTHPPDLARGNITTPQLNLFLYQTIINSAWRNRDMPRQVRPGENAAPALPLNLHYLITAYGRGTNDANAESHRALGGAMSVLHDHPVLGQHEIALALAQSGLGEQFERLRITPLPMGLEEMSKLWMMFQSHYRISAAYEVTVVLIDSRLPVKAALPVVKRGEDDRGVTSAAGLLPSLDEIRPPQSQPAARLGEDIAIAGKQLTTVDTTVRFNSPRVAQPIELAPQPGPAPGEVTVHIPDQAQDPEALSRWAPGFYTVGLVQQRAGLRPMTSNELAFALAPRITVTPTSATAGTVNLTLVCEPRIVEGQRVLLLFGDRQVPPATVVTPPITTQPLNVPPTTITFDVADVVAGSYLVRLRVDGVDSIPVDYTGTPPIPEFDPAQTVIVS